MRASEALAEALTRVGTGHLFGVIGHTTLPVIGALVRDGRLIYVPARHESNAVRMAAGYAEASGRVGLATCTHGPGLTNTLTALVAAVRQHTPLVLYVGEATSTDPSQAQYSDTPGFARLAGAGLHRTSRPEKLGSLVEKAVLAAIEERRPQILASDLPQLSVDVPRPEHVRLGEPARRAPDAAAVTRAIELLRASRRPVIVAGRGVVRSGARDELIALGSELGALLATSLLAHGLFAGEPFAIGVSGGHGSPTAQALIRDADCVLALGASLGQYQTISYGLYDKAKVIHCDVDPVAIAGIQRVDLALLGDALLVARALRAELGASRDTRYRTPEVRARLAASAVFPPGSPEGGPDAIDPRAVLAHLDRALPTERTIVSSTSGKAAEDMASLLAVPDAAAWVSGSGFSSIGLGLGTAIGAAYARPDRLTVLVSGDGSFLMEAQELDTAVRSGVRLLIVVLNDRAYGAEVPQLRKLGLPASAAQVAAPDLVAVARAYGGDGETLRAPADLPRLGEIAKAVRGTFLVDARTATLDKP